MKESFNPMGVRVILDLISALSDHVHPYSVSVLVVPSNSVIMITQNITHAELILSYNTRYDISFTPTFCGLNVEPSVIQLFYSKF